MVKYFFFNRQVIFKGVFLVVIMFSLGRGVFFGGGGGGGLA